MATNHLKKCRQSEKIVMVWKNRKYHHLLSVRGKTLKLTSFWLLQVVISYALLSIYDMNRTFYPKWSSLSENFLCYTYFFFLKEAELHISFLWHLGLSPGTPNDNFVVTCNSMYLLKCCCYLLLLYDWLLLLLTAAIL